MLFDTIPTQRLLHEATVQISIGDDTGGWSITVLISRKGQQPAIAASSVKVKAVDVLGTPLSLKNSPSGTLTDVGGSLQSTSSGVFLITGRLPPHDVEIFWGNASAQFRVVQRP